MTLSPLRMHKVLIFKEGPRYRSYDVINQYFVKEHILGVSFHSIPYMSMEIAMRCPQGILKIKLYEDFHKKKTFTFIKNSPFFDFHPLVNKHSSHPFPKYRPWTPKFLSKTSPPLSSYIIIFSNYLPTKI